MPCVMLIISENCSGLESSMDNYTLLAPVIIE